MSSSRTAPRTTSNSKTIPSNTYPTNGAANSYEINDPTPNLNYPTGNNSEFDSNPPRSSLKKNVSQYEGIYRNARFIHAISSGLIGQQVVIQTSDHERFHGVLETFSPEADVVLTASHRIDKNNNDITPTPMTPIDLIDTIDSSSQTFELHKRIIRASNIVEIIVADVDLSSNAKCSLDENPKTNQLEGDRFSRIEHFYGAEDMDPEAFEELELGDDGKAGYDPEAMFLTNREKFNTTTDFDEGKYTNVPIPQMSAVELAEIEKKVQEIERGTRNDEIDEDDAGVKRPTEQNNLDEKNSNIKNNRSNRNDFRQENDYTSSKRDNWREQRSTGHNNSRRGGGNNPKQNQYTSTNNRNTRISRSNRYADNPSPHQGRDSPSQTINNESTHNQRMNSGSFSHGQTSGPASPSATAPVQGRTIYPSTNRSSINQNSPTTYTGGSSSRTNSMSATSPSPNQQSGTNKSSKRSSINEQQLTNDEPEQAKQQRSSSNQTNTTTVNRPQQLQSKQQIPSTNNTNMPSSTHLNQDDNTSSHDSTHPTEPDVTGTTTPNSTKSNAGLNPEADEFVPVFSRESSSRPESRGASTASSASITAFMPHIHTQAIHLLNQQQQAQAQQMPPMIPGTHAQNAAALYQQYYPAAFANMPQFINAASQQMTVGVMSAPMIPSQPLITTGPNTNNSSNGSSSGMTTPNSSVSAGPTYKINSITTTPTTTANNNNNNNNNQIPSNDNGASGVNNVAPKKAVVSVQRSEQPNVSSQSVPAGQPMMFPAPPIRYYSPDYLAQQTSPASMHLPQIPFYYPMNPSGLIQAATAVGQPQNIMIPTTSTAAGSTTQGIPPIHYTGIYTDPRMYSVYSAAAINQAGVHPHWQLARSPPQQQQQQQPPPSAGDQQRNYGNGQNVPSQQTSSSSSSTNTTARPASVSSQTNPNNGNNIPPVTPQYTLNGAIPTAYGYAAPTGWIPGPQHIQQIPTAMSPQINAGYNLLYDSPQSIPPQQTAYLHRPPYDAHVYFPQSAQSQPSSQQQQQQQPQQPS